ncbi:squamosa promoter-binding-like protein 14 [Cebus imitator]|uniref:squamosa promoter-binding-like protein 14 n=1 Tax=Cebus imitator TaxID=2715852 RepID=UPI0018979B05|nr:squamosa promoter-binding-like protein 14 [Cebus imitator]
MASGGRRSGELGSLRGQVFGGWRGEGRCTSRDAAGLKRAREVIRARARGCGGDGRGTRRLPGGRGGEARPAERVRAGAPHQPPPPPRPLLSGGGRGRHLKMKCLIQGHTVSGMDLQISLLVTTQRRQDRGPQPICGPSGTGCTAGGETWSCNTVVKSVTLEPACWGLNSDSAIC